ncbi:MAG TPA: hypothetical protein VGC51_08975 [Hansschlegelia sp.]
MTAETNSRPAGRRILAARLALALGVAAIAASVLGSALIVLRSL